MSAKKYPMLSFRVSHEEKAKAKALARQLKKKYPYLTESDVYRELMGFTSTGLISLEMRRQLLISSSEETVIEKHDEPEVAQAVGKTAAKRTPLTSETPSLNSQRSPVVLTTNVPRKKKGG